MSVCLYKVIGVCNNAYISVVVYQWYRHTVWSVRKLGYAKHKVTVYVPNPLYQRLMEKVFARMQEKQQFRGVITEIVVEALRAYLA